MILFHKINVICNAFLYKNSLSESGKAVEIIVDKLKL